MSIPDHDTPEAVVVSYDPVREVARLALSKLIWTGASIECIEKIVERRKKKWMPNARGGERAAYELGIHGLHPDLIKLLGVSITAPAMARTCCSIRSRAPAWPPSWQPRWAPMSNSPKQPACCTILARYDHEVDGPHAIIGADMLPLWHA